MSRTDRDESALSKLSPRELRSFLENAVRLLTPVWLSFGPSEPRFRSFVDSIQGRAKKRRLLLSPIASDALPTHFESKLQIHPVDDELDWVLFATRIEKYDDITAAVALDDAYLLKNYRTSESNMQGANDSVVLALPAGVDEERAHIYPVSEISRSACTIEATAPFESSSTIPYVEIVGDKRILRRAAATLSNVEPWFMPDGSSRFRCTLDLNQTYLNDSSDIFDTVKDVDRVRRLMDLAGLLTVFGWSEVSGNNRHVIRFKKVERDSAELEICSPDIPKLKELTTIRVGVEIFAIYYEMEVRILKVMNERIHVTLPLALRRRRQYRRAERVSVPPQYGLSVNFYNPTTGRIRERPVEEISYIGLTIRCSKEDPVWEDLILERAELRWKEHRVFLGDLEVRSVNEREGTTLCHASIGSASAANNTALIDLIATLSHPDIRFHDGGDFSSLVKIYMHGGLLSPHMIRNLEPIVHDVEAVWKKIHRDASDIVRTLVHGPVESPNVAMTSIRGWERAWMAQHFVSVNPRYDSVIGRLQLAQLDHVLPRSDGHYILFFVKENNKVMNAFLQNFFATTGTTDSVTIITVELWCRPGDRPNRSAERDDTINMRPMRRDEEDLVSRAAQRAIGIYPAAALSMVPGEFHLPDSSKTFSKAGLVRERRCQVAMHRRQPVYAVLEERSSPGLNLTWMLNANWIIPIHPRLDQDGEVLSGVLQSILDAPAQSPLGDIFLNVPQRVLKKPIIDAGFELIAPVNLYVLNRAGLQRYYYYAARRYGEMDALIQRRNSRKNPTDES